MSENFRWLKTFTNCVSQFHLVTKHCLGTAAFTAILFIDQTIEMRDNRLVWRMRSRFSALLSRSISLWIDERPLAVSGLCWWVLDASNLITIVYPVNNMAEVTAGSCQLKARKDALNDLERALQKFPPLLERTFISCESEEKVSDGKTSEFRVMQWNVLADGSYSTVHV